MRCTRTPPACTLTGCHDPSLQGAKPTAKTCGSGGACHSSYKSDTSHYPVALHAPTNSVQANATFASTACDACHVVTGGLNAEHALATSAKTTNATNTCLNCHNNSASTSAIADNWSARDTTSACEACHTGTLAIHASVDATKHAAASSTGCAATGAGCHNSAVLSAVGADKSTSIHDTCLRCHDRTVRLLAERHAVRRRATSYYLFHRGGATALPHQRLLQRRAPASTQYYHRTGQACAVTGDDSAHHTANGMASTENSGTATNVCSDCHIGTLASEHATTGPSASPSRSVAPRAATRATPPAATTPPPARSPRGPPAVKNNWNSGSKLCSDCHTAKHDAIATVHAGSSTAGCGASGAGCHTTYDLAALHRNRAGGGGCRLSGCHDPATKSVRPSTKTCGQATGCHLSTQYNATQHNGTGGASLADGNDATHHCATGNAGQSIGGYTQSTAVHAVPQHHGTQHRARHHEPAERRHVLDRRHRQHRLPQPDHPGSTRCLR